MNNELPSWIKTATYDKKEYLKTKELIEKNNLNTVCLEANCPNRYECFSKKTATFMILGDTCTRDCLYCGVNKGTPRDVDKQEPQRIVEAVNKLELNYAVITCVTRDDLEDAGAGQFVETVENIRQQNPGCKTELLISDLNGNWNALQKIIEAKPNVVNHNIEVTRNLFSKLRPKGDYELSLELLKKTKELNPKIITKSGFMVGFGEDKAQIQNTIKDLQRVGCDIITIGQYLQPTPESFQVKKYYTPEEFEEFSKFGQNLGLKVVAGPLVRSSYKAGDL